MKLCNAILTGALLVFIAAASGQSASAVSLFHHSDHPKAKRANVPKSAHHMKVQKHKRVRH